MMNQYMEKLYPRSLIHLTRHLQGLIQGKLWLKILISMFLGLVVGLILSPHTGLVSPKAAEVFGSWLALPGNIFLGLIQMIVIPLILASIIRGMAASGFGSTAPTTTSLIPFSIIASVQGGVRP